jgi:c-di-GMP-binding flagellar brake protein YcgR
MTENRRKDYRHVFPPARRLPIRFSVGDGGVRLQGDLVDLSTGGMRVRLPADGATSAKNEPVTAAAELPLPSGALTLPSQMVYGIPFGDEMLCGFRFLPSATEEADQERERTLWRFLTQEQRHDLRDRRLNRAS